MMDLKNICDFPQGSIIESYYSGTFYKIITDPKKGTAMLKNLDNGYATEWNSYNNPHFIEGGIQRKLNF